METRIPGGPHIKTRGIVALGFQTNITHFLCCRRDRGHGGLSPEDLPPLSPCTGPPPHHTGAAKSKCQSGRRRCIPSRGQSVVATEGSFAPKTFPPLIYFLIVKQKPGSARRHPSLCFEEGPPPRARSHPPCCLIHDAPHMKPIAAWGRVMWGPVAAEAAPDPGGQVSPAGCLGDFYECDLNNPVLGGPDWPLR